MNKREIKFEFVFKNERDGKVIISQSYSLKQIIDLNIDDIREHALACDCQPIGETNVIECNCEDYYDEFELIAERQCCSTVQSKNGKEIYEGDVLFRIDTGTTGQVVFNTGRFIIQWKTMSGYVMFDSNIDTSFNDEVIGNIYENPELLK